ncbi:Uncharacterised protein [Mycolicibacterium vanbaalenii]|uniref:VOC domain-containing protein n=1 Tax=Mycolicibacterium vanbaalenii TaxID=110539 RepID=A0A5S9MPV2_MYCVN|nr:VOC family protein [Mycolicibacterium vanbaalenii]CAA0079055.1 Uncharacterised protein [Mycolicibacterium vanbaalenii]
MSGHRLTHIGLCVRDIERATEFYCSALGFEKIGEMHVADEATAQLLDVDDLILDLVYLHRDGFRLELIGYTRPAVTGDTEPRAMNALGFTHLSFRVDDIDSLAAAVVEHGGRLLSQRTVSFGPNRAMMLTDPDGNLLEFIERTAGTD